MLPELLWLDVEQQAMEYVLAVVLEAEQKQILNIRMDLRSQQHLDVF